MLGSAQRQTAAIGKDETVAAQTSKAESREHAKGTG